MIFYLNIILKVILFIFLSKIFRENAIYYNIYKDIKLKFFFLSGSFTKIVLNIKYSFFYCRFKLKLDKGQIARD
jgi:hypothetical protein